jgi:hypothetical protein
MKVTAFMGTAQCSLVEVHRRFIGAYCLHNQHCYHPDGESKHLRNVDELIRDYSDQYPRSVSSSFYG